MTRPELSSPSTARPVLVYGPPGSGKSATGKILAKQMGRRFVDLDQEIETQLGRTIPEIFAREGETAFRNYEQAALEKLVTQTELVVALGGGTLTWEGSLEIANKLGRVICLSAQRDTLIERLLADPNQRPLLKGDLAKNLDDLLGVRTSHYTRFPIQVDTTRLTHQQAADECQVALGRYRVVGMGPEYDVVIQNGGLDCLGEELAWRMVKGPLAVTSETQVAGYYLPAVLASVGEGRYTAGEVLFPTGEASKTIQTVVQMWQDFLRMGLERSGTVLAVGGGVTTDLAGFAAATYQRGVRWVSVPTSLLGMVDAGIGGKTGIDLPEGKNLAGAFHAPALVWIDPLVLATLPEDEIRNGMAEVVKHGVIADPRLFDQVSGGFPAIPEDWERLVSRAVGVKVRIICADPYEAGLRASLNLGHTIGHGVETASHYSLRHGEAVSIGMVQEAHLAERIGLADKGLAEQIADVLTRLGLPVGIPAGLDVDEILQTMTHDKKRSDGKLRFSLPVRIGEVRVGISVEPSDLLSILHSGR